MTVNNLTIELDLDSVKMNQYDMYISQRSFLSKVIERTDTQISIALPGPQSGR